MANYQKEALDRAMFSVRFILERRGYNKDRHPDLFSEDVEDIAEAVLSYAAPSLEKYFLKIFIDMADTEYSTEYTKTGKNSVELSFVYDWLEKLLKEAERGRE